MNVTIVLCHPFDRSFCKAVAAELRTAAVEAGATVHFHDLYAEAPDPLLTGAEIARRFSSDDQIQAYSREIESCDLLLVVHPDWWSAPPALLKGWLERVFRPGVAYEWQGEEFQEKEHVPLLTSIKALFYVTTDRQAASLPEAIELFWQDACSYSGMEYLGVTFYPDLRRSTHRGRRAWLREAQERISDLCKSNS
ncbi:MAG: NAD(P)H-dependent oxidoreductase [Spirochaetales bacterium]